MKNIEIGEYVRTKNGYILRNTIKEHKHIIDEIINQNEKYKYEFDNIIKHSKNLIDLIEIGDLIKFKNKSSNSLENKEIIIHIFDNSTLEELKKVIINKEIKIISILAKEQFEDNCYRVEEI